MLIGSSRLNNHQIHKRHKKAFRKFRGFRGKKINHRRHRKLRKKSKSTQIEKMFNDIIELLGQNDALSLNDEKGEGLDKTTYCY